MVGSIAANLHEGSRSEYLAQFVFSSFGTAFPVPHQEDSGIDFHCTLTERVGQRAWPRSYYAVQVKSEMEPWVFKDADEVRWIIEHPLPIFLCIVRKTDARIPVYHTSPRFVAWAAPIQQNRLELVPGTGTKGLTVDCNWLSGGNTFTLNAPILDFTIQKLLEDDFHAQVKQVLKHWIDYDLGNLVRIRNGMPTMWMPYDYETNSTQFKGWTLQGGPFREDSLALAQNRLKELLSHLQRHHHRNGDLLNATWCAMVLRQLYPDYALPTGPDDPGNPHDGVFHSKLNQLFGLPFGCFAYEACDSLLLELVNRELAKHRIIPVPETASAVQNGGCARGAGT